MRFSPKTLFAILLCAATLTLPTTAAAARPTQKTRAKAQAPAPHTEITKEKIESIVLALEEAAKKRDFTSVVPYLAPDFKYKLDGGGRATRAATRAEYIEIVKLAAEVTLDYSYLRKSLSITIAPDGQSATVHTEAFEIVTLAQGTLAGHSKSITTFKIYKGKILISSSEGTIEYV